MAAGKPLLGKAVLVTRPRHQAADLIKALEELGATPIEFSTIKIVPPESYDELDRAIIKLATSHEPRAMSYDWLIFTSVNGVTFFFDRLAALGFDKGNLRGVKLAAIGPSTARKLTDLGLKVDDLPFEYRAEAVIEGLVRMGVKGARVLIPRAEVAREILPQKLAQAGAQVEVVTAYRTVPDNSSLDRLEEMFKEGKIDIITFTSSSTVRNFLDLLKKENLPKILKKTKVVCIGPVTAETAKELGLRVDAVAEEYTIAGLVKAIVKMMGM